MQHFGHRWSMQLCQAACLLLCLALVFLGEAVTLASSGSLSEATESHAAAEPAVYPPAAPVYHFSELSELEPGQKNTSPTEVATRVPVLMYHSISVDSNQLCVSPDRFAEQLDWLLDEGYSTITMESLLDHLYRGSTLPPRPVVITMDDGYLDNYDYAFPLLKERKMVATVFMISDFTGLEYRLSRSNIQEMSSCGIEFGSHTLDHPDLRMVKEPRLVEELEDSRRFIGAITNREVVSFCYPYGKYNQRVIDAVKAAGYYGAVTTEPGMVTEKSNLYRMARVRVNGSDRLEDFKAKLGHPRH